MPPTRRPRRSRSETERRALSRSRRVRLGPMTAPMDPAPRIAEELRLPPAGVRAALRLLGEGATVAFIARYRKEQTGGLDEVAIGAIVDKRDYVVSLEQRRTVILEAIAAQGKLTADLERAIRRYVAQGGARRSVPALQDEAANARVAGAGARPSAAGESPPRAAATRRPAPRGGGVRRRRERRPRRRRRARRCARHRR